MGIKIGTEEARRRALLVKNRHSFSSEESIKGGKKRAEIAAVERRAYPTHAEKMVRDCLETLGIPYEAEYPVKTLENMTQYFDIYIPSSRIALEVDGSLRWHDPKYLTSNMAKYDHIKEKWAHENNVSVIRITLDDISGKLQSILSNL